MIIRGASFLKKVELLKRKGFSQKRAESFASMNTTARQIHKKGR